jgi:hypothetical protein
MRLGQPAIEAATPTRARPLATKTGIVGRETLNKMIRGREMDERAL